MARAKQATKARSDAAALAELGADEIPSGGGSIPAPPRPKVRQAVVVIHGMGEQLPLATVNGFYGAALPVGDADPARVFSRPDNMNPSFEARRYIARRRTVDVRDPEPGEPATQEVYAQTEFFEYHWSHLMTGNEIRHLVPTLRRVILTRPGNVPSGLRVVWAIVWLTVIAAAYVAVSRDLVSGLTGGTGVWTQILELLLGGGIALSLATAVVAAVQRWVTTSFVDVARYLDTSPASYAVRRDVRTGIVDLLRNLHAAEVRDRRPDGTLQVRPKYQRIVVVAHSLGGYIGYDAIARLWWELTSLHAGASLKCCPLAGEVAVGLNEVEKAAADIGDVGTDDEVEEFQRRQRNLWVGLRAQGHPWRITDFITVGTPMYMADRIAYREAGSLEDRIRRLELPTCPPASDPSPGTRRPDQSGHVFSWKTPDMHWWSLHHAAPFAVVRWTNLWYPARLGFFGDWFGGPLQPLFGVGIRDVRIERDGWSRWLPAGAHSRYFANATRDDAKGSAGDVLRAALDLPSTTWVQPTATDPCLQESYSD
jgi:hypothetical protein